MSEKSHIWIYYILAIAKKSEKSDCLKGKNMSEFCLKYNEFDVKILHIGVILLNIYTFFSRFF